MSASIEVYDPVASAGQVEAPARSTFESLRGRVVGFIDNAKPNFNFLVDDLAELLTERHGVARVLKHRKLGQVPVTPAVLEDFAAQCDVVITGSGD